MTISKTDLTVSGITHPKINQSNILYNTFSELIPVTISNIGGKELQSVSGRKLHTFLAVGRDFTTWIKARIKQYRFVAGVDYVIVENLSPPKRGSAKYRQQIEYDYILNLNMGKELSMVERSEQGRAIRQYFINCERELIKSVPEITAQLRRQLKARIAAANNYKPMCAALELSRAEQGKETLPRHYSNESNMISRIVLGGLTTSQWSRFHEYPTHKARDYMTSEQLEHLSYLESTNITLIDMGMDYPQRKEELTRLSQRYLAKCTAKVTP